MRVLSLFSNHGLVIQGKPNVNTEFFSFRYLFNRTYIFIIILKNMNVHFIKNVSFRGFYKPIARMMTNANKITYSNYKEYSKIFFQTCKTF